MIALSIVLRIVHDTPRPIGPKVYKKSVQISYPPVRLVVRPW